MAIRGLTAAELLHVAGGETTGDEIVVTAKSEGGGGFSWGGFASGLDSVATGFNNAGGIAAGATAVAGVAAVAQGGADLPNDALTGGLIVATGAAYGLGALASYGASAARAIGGVHTAIP